VYIGYLDVAPHHCGRAIAGAVGGVVTKDIKIARDEAALGERIIIYFTFLHVEDVYFVGTNEALYLELFRDGELCLANTVNIGY
jgi:hypothetical protein